MAVHRQAFDRTPRGCVPARLIGCEAVATLDGPGYRIALETPDGQMDFVINISDAARLHGATMNASMAGPLVLPS